GVARILIEPIGVKAARQGASDNLDLRVRDILPVRKGRHVERSEQVERVEYVDHPEVLEVDCPGVSGIVQHADVKTVVFAGLENSCFAPVARSALNLHVERSDAQAAIEINDSRHVNSSLLNS